MPPKKPHSTQVSEKADGPKGPYSPSLHDVERMKLSRRSKILAVLGTLSLGVIGLGVATVVSSLNKSKYFTAVQANELIEDDLSPTQKSEANQCFIKNNTTHCFDRILLYGGIPCQKTSELIRQKITGIPSSSIKDHFLCEAENVKSNIEAVRGGIKEDTACLERRRACMEEALSTL